MSLAIRKKPIFFENEQFTCYTPDQIKKAYNVPASLDGHGQTIAILEFDSGYSKADIDAFAKLNGITNYDLEFVCINGGTNDMCGRFTFTIPDELAEHYGLMNIPADIQPLGM